MSHIYGNEKIVEWLQENEYHPRSPKHGSVSCMALLDDLLHDSDLFREAAEEGQIVYKEDFTVGEGELRWNVDLVVGPPEDDVQTAIDGDRPIAEEEPAEVWLAVDAKSVMTEHGKARRNRQRDINSFADIMHRHYPGSVSGGVILLNVAEEFRSPLRDEGDITEHVNIERLVEETVEIFRTIERSEGEVDPNVDAVATVVVEHTNIEDGEETVLIEEQPAPDEDSIVDYRNFLDILIETFEARFLIGEPPNMAQLREADTHRNELNERMVEISHQIYQIGSAIERDELEQVDVENLREKMDRMRTLLDEIEESHVN